MCYMRYLNTHSFIQNSSIVLGRCLQGFGSVYMYSLGFHAVNDVLDPVLQQFYSASSSHSSSVLKVPIIITKQPHEKDIESYT